MSDTQAGLGSDGTRTVRTIRKTRPSPRYRRAILQRSGLPRLERGARHDTSDGRIWTDYLAPLVKRLRLGRPVPAWSVEVLREAGRAHLTLQRLHATLDAEMKKPDGNPAEQRRLRSEIRRTVSQRRTHENILAKLQAEQKAQEQAAVPSFQSLLAKVGRR